MKKFFFFFMLAIGSLAMAQSALPTLVWVRSEGGERNEHVFFRREFTLDTLPKQAKLHVYADSRYALYVNGLYLGFGPVRSFHANPHYDSYDILPHLDKGKNVIAVHALCNGMLTYQLFDYQGGFTAWGEIQTKNQKIDLSTNQGWLCRKSKGYDQTAPRLSFATGAIENWDSRNEWDWNLKNTAAQGWAPPIPLKEQTAWGTFAPRPIPKLTNQRIPALRLMVAHPLTDNEALYSFRIPTPDGDMGQYNTSRNALAYTFIHSPKDQNVTVGLWWGQHYLNGKLLKKDTIQESESYRRQYTLPLKKGWNTYVVRYGIIWGSWDYYMAVPKTARLSLSTIKQKGSREVFRTYGPFMTEERIESIEKLDLATDISNIVQQTEPDGWVSQNRNKDAAQPARDLAWKELDSYKPLSVPADIKGFRTIPVSKNGIALFYEMGETQLGRIFVEGDFPTGTQIDIGFSEELDTRGFPWLYKRFQIGAGMRFIASEQKKTYETFKPYGLKYLHINISGNDRPVNLKDVGVVRQVYPFKKVGSFRCSDPVLNKIWEAGWRTLQLCAEDSYTDTPFRERGLYAGDMLPQAAITMAVSGDTRLLEYSLKVFQDMYREEMETGKENRHNDFPLITQVILDYCSKYKNDWSLAKKYYPNYAALLHNHLSKKDKNGLIPASRVFLEWTDINKENAAMTAYQALIVKSLLVLADWAERFDQAADAKYFGKEAERLRDSVNAVLWDKNKKVFWDGIKNDTLLREAHATSQIWPMLYGITDMDQKRHILSFLEHELKDIGKKSRKRKITPYSSFYLLALLYKNQKAEFAEYFMKKHWGPMALHSSAPTVWENFDIEGGQGTSSHAWSGHPTYFLSTEVLGVNLGFHKPFDPSVIEIAPQSETLSWAEGTVAHPLGPVFVKWRIKGDMLFLTYRAPQGVKVKVRPKGKLGKLKLMANDATHGY